MRGWSFVVVGIFLVAPVLADEVEDTTARAMTAYRAGELSEAAKLLDSAAEMIRRRRGKTLGSAFPPALPGWKKEEIETDAVAAAVLGGMTTTKCRYTRGKKAVEITIVADSPMIQAFLPMFNNPMLLAMNKELKLERIRGQKALVAQSGGSVEVTIIVAGTILVKVDGKEASASEVRAYAEAMDYDAISAMANK